MRGGQAGNAFARGLQNIHRQLVELRQRQFRLRAQVRVPDLVGQGAELAGNPHDLILVLMAHEHLLLLLADNGRFLLLRLVAHLAERGIQSCHGIGDGLVAGPDGEVLVHIGSDGRPHSGAV